MRLQAISARPAYCSLILKKLTKVQNNVKVDNDTEGGQKVKTGLQIIKRENPEMHLNSFDSPNSLNI